MYIVHLMIASKNRMKDKYRILEVYVVFTLKKILANNTNYIKKNIVKKFKQIMFKTNVVDQQFLG